MTESNDTLRALLDGRVQDIQRYIDRLKGDRDTARRLIENIAPVLEQAERDLNEALASIGILFGQTAPLAPRDIRSDENALGLRVGPLQMGPPSSEAPTRDLDFFRATMRALADQANHQARLVGDELARREQASAVPTGAFQTVQPPEPVVCKHCGRAVARLPHADWHHKDSGFIACYPDGVVSTEAEPVQPGDATQVVPAVYPTTWEYDGTVWELRAQLVDRAGEVWEWTGKFAAHRPLYESGGDPLTLPELIELHGPVFYRKPADLDQATATPAQQDGGQG